MDAFSLRTKRLVLYPLTADDIEESVAVYSDEAVMQFLDGGTRDRQTATHMIQANERCWSIDGWGIWAVRDSNTKAFLGECGLSMITDLPGAEVEFVCTLTRQSWGRGYSTEAGHVVLNDAWRRYSGDQIHAVILPGNTHGASLLIRLGFRRLDDQRVGGITRHVWEMQRLG